MTSFTGFLSYVAEPWIDKLEEHDRRQKITDNNGKITETLDRSDNWQDCNERQDRTRKFAEDADYTGWDTIDRGHLFPVQFTKDWLENKATNKITNTVPKIRHSMSNNGKQQKLF